MLEPGDSFRSPKSQENDLKRENKTSQDHRDRSPVGRGRFRKMEPSSPALLDEGSGMPELTKKKFTGRCRLFVGNLPNGLKESELRELFKEYGEVSECFLSSKGFGFIRMDTRAKAEVAKEMLDGFLVKGRPLRVRFAAHGAALRVKELSPAVSNELLFQAFSAFGDIERAVHIVDERGRPTGEGIIEFERKPGAMDALRRINDGVFLMTSNPKPIYVEPMEAKDDEDGLAERMIGKNAECLRERAQAPRFASHGSFEYEFGTRWKELYQMERIKREQLEREFKEARERLENDMELAYTDYQAMLLREDLRRRQEELDRLEAARQERMVMSRGRVEEANRGYGLPSLCDSNIAFGSGSPYDRPSVRASHPPSGGPPFARSEDSTGGGTQNAPKEASLVHGVQKLLQMFQSPPPPVASGPAGLSTVYPSVYSQEMSQPHAMSEYYGEGVGALGDRNLSGGQNVFASANAKYGKRRR